MHSQMVGQNVLVYDENRCLEDFEKQPRCLNFWKLFYLIFFFLFFLTKFDLLTSFSSSVVSKVSKGNEMESKMVIRGGN